MSTLLIEHKISDFATWHDAFTRFAARRREGGVIGELIMRPVDDPHYVIVELEFTTLDEARQFQHFLESQVWSTPASSPALVGSPRARIAEVVVDRAPAGSS